MHEEALLRDLRRKLDEVARAEGGVRIVRVRLWVGALAHVSADGVRRRWPELVAGTPAEASTLEIVVSDDPSGPYAEAIRLEDVTVSDRDVPPISGTGAGGPTS
jgi:hydrogenase nickel incorporation protein HypA/HybF